MNNVRNDERYFVVNEDKKKFSLKVSEDEYSKLQKNNYYNIEPISENITIDDSLYQLEKVKSRIEIHILKLIKDFSSKKPDFNKYKLLKKQLDLFDNHLIIYENEIEKRAAICLLRNDYTIIKKVKPET